MLRVFSHLERVAASVVPVLILGETGTGKEVVARSIHDSGPRRDHSFRCVNCGGLPESLVEATLFGHERGSFTGAAERKLGVFEAAHGGTVFLDEIGELPPLAQAALLRVLESKRITRVGGVEEIPVDVRILSATHRDLERMCERGEFRWDLFYRLNVLSISLPPLRERVEDIFPLAERFVASAGEANGRPEVELGPAALERMNQYSWPGNVRELKNAMERAVVIAAGDTIEVEDLPETVRGGAVPSPSGHPAGPTGVPVFASTGASALPPPMLDEEELEGTEDLGRVGEVLDYKSQMQAAERRVLLGALERAELNQTEAARLLQMPLRTLVHKLKTLGLREELARLKAAKSRRAK